MNSADPMAPRPARVRTVQRETHDTFTFRLSAIEGSLQGFAPGQFSMLYGFGVGEMPISISGDPGAPGQLVYTVRAVGRGTESLVSRKDGDLIGVRGPFGKGWPLDRAIGRDLLVVAGGIGLAPLRPVVYQVSRERDRYGRLIVLYGARSPKDLLYRKELARWGRLPNSQVMTTVDFGGLNWRGNVGVVTNLLQRVRLEPELTVAMVCGPEIMMHYVATALERRGLSADDIYLSMERSMSCGIGLCGHCQLGPALVCRDGPVFPYRSLRPWYRKREI